jgi:phytol kinase
MNNWLGLLISTLYIFSMIGIAEGLRRRQGYAADFTRKFIHITVGMLSWGLHWLFDNPWPFVAAALAFMALNYLDWRYGFFAAMASSNRSNLGTVYFPLAAAAVALFFWERPPLMVAAMMPLTWGDGLAPVAGRLFGRRAYTIRFGLHTAERTVEGSIAFFVAALLFTWLALWLIPGPPQMTPLVALLPALVVAFCTTLVEAVTLWGVDNLLVTAVAAGILYLWPFGAVAS